MIETWACGHHTASGFSEYKETCLQSLISKVIQESATPSFRKIQKYVMPTSTHVFDTYVWPNEVDMKIWNECTQYVIRMHLGQLRGFTAWWEWPN